MFEEFGKNEIINLESVDFKIVSLSKYDTYDCKLKVKNHFEVDLSIPKDYVDSYYLNASSSKENLKSDVESDVLKECFKYIYLRDTKKFDYKVIETQNSLIHRMTILNHIVDVKIDINESEIAIINRTLNTKYKYVLNQKLYKETRELIELKDKFEEYVMTLFEVQDFNSDEEYEENLLILIGNFNGYINERIYINSLVKQEYQNSLTVK